MEARASSSRTRRAGSLCTNGGGSELDRARSLARSLSARGRKDEEGKKAKKGKVTKDRREQFLVTFAAYNLPTLRSHYKLPPFRRKKIQSNPIAIQFNSIQFSSIQFWRTSTNFCWLLILILIIFLFLFFFPKSYPKRILN